MDLIRVAENEDFAADYYKSMGMYKVTVVVPELNYEADFWFDAYEEKEVREVINCKDCVEYDGTYHRCKLLSEDPDPFTCGHDVKMEPDDFCSFGELKMDGE